MFSVSGAALSPVHLHVLERHDRARPGQLRHPLRRHAEGLPLATVAAILQANSNCSPAPDLVL